MTKKSGSKTYAIHINVLSSLHTDSTLKSKQVSQLLFGELCVIKSERNNFLYIESNIDSYCGWVRKDVFATLSPVDYERLKDRRVARIYLPLAKVVDVENGMLLYLPAGSFIHDYDERDNSCLIAKRRFRMFDNAVSYLSYGHLDSLENAALSFLNAPFVDGGKSILGIDMANYIQLVFSLCGFDVPRSSQNQLKMGVAVYSLDQMRAGDVLFITDQGIVTQSFLYLGDNRLVYVDEKVKIIPLSSIENVTSPVVIRRLV